MREEVRKATTRKKAYVLKKDRFLHEPRNTRESTILAYVWRGGEWKQRERKGEKKQEGQERRRKRRTKRRTPGRDSSMGARLC